jgi:hypothetical protein
MAGEVGLKDVMLERAFTAIQQFLDPVLAGEVNERRWDFQSWSWK